MTMALVKAVMFRVPRNFNVLGECDVPFKLPSDPRTFRRKKIQQRLHYRQRREVYSQLEEVLTMYGFNGNACVKRLICDAQSYLPPKGTLMVGDILSTVLTFSVEETLENDKRFHNYCNDSIYSDCQVPFLHYIMGGWLS